MSAEAENEYFSDGLSEELINSLTQLKNLRVVARTSAFAFKGKELDIRDIGNKLNVNTILEGSVRKAGDKIRITAQLINVADGYHLWSERYDRDLKDVFAIQDEIAREIANKFKTDYRDKGVASDAGYSPSIGAYELYLKGRYYFNKFSPEWINQAFDSFAKDSDKAIENLEKAIEINPHNTNARLWYELALSLLDQDFNEALTHLTTALNLDPLNLLVRLRMGYIYCYKYDFETAIRYYKQIIHAEPGNAAGYHGLMDIYGMMGEYDLAIREGEKAVKLGNYAVPFVSILGLYSARGGKIQRANELLSILIKRMETEYVSPFWIAVIHLGLEELDKMFEWFEKAYNQRDGNLLYLFAPPFDPIREDDRFIKLRQKMGFKK